jgi:hypothetical protein
MKVKSKKCPPHTGSCPQHAVLCHHSHVTPVSVGPLRQEATPWTSAGPPRDLTCRGRNVFGDRDGGDVNKQLVQEIMIVCILSAWSN